MVLWDIKDRASGDCVAEMDAELACVAAAAPVLTLDDVARAYPTWWCWPTVGGCMARAALVPSLVVHSGTAPGLLAEIEASIERRREGGNR